MKFTGIWIPADVATHPVLSDKAKITYGLIASLDNEDGCYASNGYISRVLGTDERHVRRLIEDLIQHGLVMRVLDNSGRTLKTIERAALQCAIEESNGNDHGHSNPRGEGKNVRGGRVKMSSNSKEDKKEDTKITKQLDPLPFNTPAFINAWSKWVDYRRDLKKPLHWKTINATFAELKGWSEADAIVSIDMSIAKGWLSLFKPKYTSKTLTSDDHKQPW